MTTSDSQGEKKSESPDHDSAKSSSTAAATTAQEGKSSDGHSNDAHSNEGHAKLGEFAATAICGNDITSSCLYVSALAIIAAGKVAPFALLIVAALLFLFRKIYGEVVGALPLNGGAYNALLNTTSKFSASIAACLTILSYMATAVISAGEAVHYANVSGWYVLPVTTGLLLVFTCLTVWGISESAQVAIGIFVTHLVTLSLLLLFGIGFVVFSTTGTSTLVENYKAPLSIMEDDPNAPPPPAHADEGDAAEAKADSDEHADDHGHGHGHAGPAVPKVRKAIKLGSALFFGFAVALLGISGFESSANFVEEQKPGVFPKTLRNMWRAVSFFNPTMAFLALALIPLSVIQTDEVYKTKLLSKMAEVAGGAWFGKPLSYLVSIDAVLVLSGAVLTSFVGVNGLVHRMALDRCLPQFLLKSSSRGTTHRILISFFLLCLSVLYITKGDIEALAGVYTISFLTVMLLFAIGNVLLKVRRGKLPRPVKATWLAVVLAITAVTMGLIGNAIRDPEYLFVFACYFVPTMSFVAIMLYRIPLLRICLSLVRGAASSLVTPLNNTARFVRNWIDEINSQQVVFFTRGDNISNLNNAMLYVAANEDTNNIKVVTVVNDKKDVPKKLEEDLHFLDEAYPDIDIEFVALEDKFGPELIQRLSKEWNVPTNLMFIGSPGGKLVYGLEELGGVRLII